jgi:hypothetical protein
LFCSGMEIEFFFFKNYTQSRRVTEKLHSHYNFNYLSFVAIGGVVCVFSSRTMRSLHK